MTVILAASRLLKSREEPMPLTEFMLPGATRGSQVLANENCSTIIMK
jgi:hypothetical protein